MTVFETECSYSILITQAWSQTLHCFDWSLFAAIAGTLTHMAPEVIMRGHVSKAADVYAFGIMMWEVSMCLGYLKPKFCVRAP